jgi:hypothetical protein
MVGPTPVSSLFTDVGGGSPGESLRLSQGELRSSSSSKESERKCYCSISNRSPIRSRKEGKGVGAPLSFILSLHSGSIDVVFPCNMWQHDVDEAEGKEVAADLDRVGSSSLGGATADILWRVRQSG